MSSANSAAAETTTSGLTNDTGRTNHAARGRSGGRGRGGSRGGARGQGRGNAGTRSSRGSGFKGANVEMNGNVFECYDEQTDRRQYAKTVEALATYVKKHLKYAEDLAPLFAPDMKLPILDKPMKPVGEEIDETDLAIWNEEVHDYTKGSACYVETWPQFMR